LLKAVNPLTQNSKLKTQNSSREEFWALKDVSFEIKQGDRVGIIGRNGAGKSTLLKVLSRIVEPTKGSISIRGRVASLLEVGTGFHPELTGRENVYLNGAILGMGREEIKRKFDEIVAFAEVEKFLDTPVKRYSSGMYVRLAFSVAAHLEPEILIIDEVLAVGDAEFQKKCLGKMEEVGKEGRTVLFVSHNVATITQLCTKAIYMVKGKIDCIGGVNSVVSKYLMTDVKSNGSIKLISENRQMPKKPLFFRELKIINRENNCSSEIDVRYSFTISLIYEVTIPLKNVELSIRIETDEGVSVLTTHQSNCDVEAFSSRNIGIHEALIEIPPMFLAPGNYVITIIAHEPMVQFYDLHEHILTFNINETGTKLAKYQRDRKSGIVIANFLWVDKPLTTTESIHL